jgi:isopenicillin N synthase-like dioxygenase
MPAKLVDIAPLKSLSAKEREECGKKILGAFERYGFLYLSHHTVSLSVLENVFRESSKFFARPQAQKDSLAWTSPQANRGYVTHGREKVSHGQTAEEVAKDRDSAGADLKESMEIGREGESDHPNRWPDQIDAAGAQFREVMEAFFMDCKQLHAHIMAAIALGFDLGENYFDDFVFIGDNTLRLLHYPAVRREVFQKNPGQVRAGAHTDYGSITLLFQDDRGGLQVVGDDGEWKDVKPIPGTVVVNAGDLLARWSNERIKSTEHRVVEPPLPPGGKGVEEYPARYSIAYFCNPDFHKTIEALPGTYGGSTGREKRFEAINSGDYLVQRLAATY